MNEFKKAKNAKVKREFLYKVFLFFVGGDGGLSQNGGTMTSDEIKSINFGIENIKKKIEKSFTIFCLIYYFDKDVNNLQKHATSSV